MNEFDITTLDECVANACKPANYYRYPGNDRCKDPLTGLWVWMGICCCCCFCCIPIFVVCCSVCLCLDLVCCIPCNCLILIIVLSTATGKD